ncbi:hypothetical protein CH366_13410 [Leptospira harrisiae]|uniref:Uncharacterized protein n=1 Tax=Leptospira harrisiae TaxID=2023189 RepID=A0A2N0AK80_9LEPT|nr:hypothetical protein CH364_11710 [Leptospira harrisiae]PKA07403.1 hypothetical protein CH366_13410 [Leptospira harrisiae]
MFCKGFSQRYQNETAYHTDASHPLVEIAYFKTDRAHSGVRSRFRLPKAGQALRIPGAGVLRVGYKEPFHKLKLRITIILFVNLKVVTFNF